MIKLNQRLGVVLCGTFVEFEIRSIPKSADDTSPVLYIADVAVRNPDRSVEAGDLEVDLLGSNRVPLARVRGTSRCGDAVTVDLGPSRSEHFFDAFDADGDAPETLVLGLHGDRVELSLDPMARHEQDDGCDDDDDDDDDEKKKEHEEGGGPKCCPDTFVTPVGNQPTVRRAVGGGSIHFCRPWTVTATFSPAPPPCHCPCCEYRQYIRGSWWVGFDFPLIGFVPLMNASPTLALPIPLPWPLGLTLYVPTTLNPAAWQEDTAYINMLLRAAYGHRDEMGTPAFNLPLQDYPNPCEYWGFDGPRVQAAAALVGAGLTLSVTTDFRGEIIDSCRGGVAAGPNIWTWNHTAPL